MDDTTRTTVQETLTNVLAAAAAQPIEQLSFAPKGEPSSAQIIEHMSQLSGLMEKFSLKQIDDCIARLQKLRELVQQKCRHNVESTVEFVRLVEDGLRDVQKIEQQADLIADAAIST